MFLSCAENSWKTSCQKSFLHTEELHQNVIATWNFLGQLDPIHLKKSKSTHRLEDKNHQDAEKESPSGDFFLRSGACSSLALPTCALHHLLLPLLVTLQVYSRNFSEKRGNCLSNFSWGELSTTAVTPLFAAFPDQRHHTYCPASFPPKPLTQSQLLQTLEIEADLHTVTSTPCNAKAFKCSTFGINNLDWFHCFESPKLFSFMHTSSISHCMRVLNGDINSCRPNVTKD